MDSYYRCLKGLGLPFFKRKNRNRKLNKYVILLNEPTEIIPTKSEPCALADELLPGVTDQRVDTDDLVKIVGEILESKIKAHAKVENVAFLRPDKLLNENSLSIVPVMYRITAEDFAQKDKSVFKIIECRNATKLVTDLKPTLTDRLIALGHQVVVVKLETSFVPYTDFAYAVLRQLNFEWKLRLPRSFFFPDDVCKVEFSLGRDLCVVSPSMPDGDLNINKKMGLLNYEVLMMIKTSCLSAMQNYLIKRDLRVGNFSDTLDGVSSLRYLYRKLQDRLQTELRYHAPEPTEVDESDRESSFCGSTATSATGSRAGSIAGSTAPTPRISIKNCNAERGDEKDDDRSESSLNSISRFYRDDGRYSQCPSDGEEFNMDEFVEFRASCEKMHNAISKENIKHNGGGDREGDDFEFPVEDFSAEEIVKILQLPFNCDEESGDEPDESESN